MKISASMMCSDLININEAIKIFEKNKVDYLHIDVMDGHFVPNLGIGVDYIKNLREMTDIPLDLHLMIDNPEYKFDWFKIKKNDIVSIHYESTCQVQRSLDLLKNYKCKKFLAINPATPIYVIEEVMDYIEGINLLMVNPGFAGQKIVESTLNKAKKLFEFLKEKERSDIEVEVDGNINLTHGKILKNYGASIFVLGTSSIFKNGIKNYSKNIKEFRNYLK